MRLPKIETEFFKSIYGKTEEQLTKQEKETKETICKKYIDRFQTDLENGNIPHAYGEQFKQCLDPFVPYWFVSNEGNIWSAAGTSPRKVIPYRACVPGKIQRKKLDTPYGSVFLHQVIAKQWCSDEFIRLLPDEPVEIHHEDPCSENPDRAEVLKRLPKSIHEGATKAQRYPTAEKMDAYYQEDIRKALKKNPNIPQITCDLTPILEYICNFAETHAGVAYHTGADGSCRVELIPPQGNIKPDAQTQEVDRQQE